MDLALPAIVAVCPLFSGSKSTPHSCDLSIVMFISLPRLYSRSRLWIHISMHIHLSACVLICIVKYMLVRVYALTLSTLLNDCLHMHVFRFILMHACINLYQL